MKIPSWIKQVYLMELRKIITYRADFWVNFVGQTIFSILISYFLWLSIFESNSATQINGYTLNKIIFYYLIVPIVFRIQQGETIGAISGDIYNGTLNKYLLYPISFYTYKITTYIANSTFFFLQLCTIALVYYFFINTDSNIKLSFINFLLFSIVLMVSSLTYFYLNSITELIGFWADNIWSLGVITRFLTRFLGGGLIPLSFFPIWSVELLQFTPFPYIVDFPMKVFFGDFTYVSYIQSLIILSLWTLLFRFISKTVWNRGQYQYTGIGI